MRFSFEADMKKGECSRCPICKCQHSQSGGIWYCGITSTVVTEIFDVDPADCPLEEYHGIEWYLSPRENSCKEEE